MNSLLFYIISTSVCLSLFVLTYLLFLKENTRFNLCRFYLIAAILFSFIIPFITIDVGFSFISKNETITNLAKPTIAEKIEVQELEAANPVQIETRNWDIDYKQIGGIILLSISLLLFVRFIFRFGSIILIHTSGNRYENEDGTNLIFTDRTDNAFSFLGYIFINPLKFTDEEKRLIIEHEREHIKHFHSIDLILIELLIVLQWFNPFAYIARRKLIEIHEFIADNGVIQKGADPYSYQNLLLSVVSSSCLPTVGNQLSALITKKRIAMIGKPLNQTGRWINFLILVPITIALIIGISAFSPSKPKSENQEAKKSELIEIAKKQGITNSIEELYFDLKSNEYQEKQTIELIGGNDYTFHFLPRTKEEGIHAYINSNIKDVPQGGVIIFSGTGRLMVHVKKTSTFTLRIGNRSSISQVDLLALICNNGKHNPENDTLINNQTIINPIAIYKKKQNEVVDTFLVVEQMPTFGNSNEDEFPKWIAANMQYPKEAIEKGINGKVIVEFLITKDGSIKNPKIVKSVNPLLDTEALRLINTCPKWNPGKQRGIAVDVKYVLPIDFSAKELKKTTKANENQENDDQIIKSLENRAEKEIKDIYLKDFKISLQPTNNQKYSIILKKDCKYSFNFFTKNKTDKLNFFVASEKEKEPKYEIVSVCNDLSKIDFTPKETGVYHLQIENASSNKVIALLYLTLKELNFAEQTNSSTIVNKKIETDEDEVFMVVEQMPVFGNGNQDEFSSWVASNIQYPKEAVEKGIQGRVFVQFIIEKDGSIINANILKGIDPLLDKEALRVILQSPKWKPGIQNGRNVRVYWTHPVIFKNK